MLGSDDLGDRRHDRAAVTGALSRRVRRDALDVAGEERASSDDDLAADDARVCQQHITFAERERMRPAHRVIGVGGIERRAERGRPELSDRRDPVDWQVVGPDDHDAGRGSVLRRQEVGAALARPLERALVSPLRDGAMVP
jgi:hypothetical protein